MTDILQDIIQRVAEIKQLPSDVVSKIECELRRDFGGERHYIARIGESAARMMAQRDIAIRAQHRRLTCRMRCMHWAKTAAPG